MGNLCVCEEEVEQDQERNCLVYIMGNAIGSGAGISSSSSKSSKRNVDKKVEQASKTGVLNLAGMVRVITTIYSY